MTDILAGNTIRSVNPFWGKWRITDGVTGSKVRPGGIQDRHDQRQQGRPRVRLPRAAEEQEPAGARRRRLDGQLRQLAQRRQAVAGHVGAAVVGDPVRRVEGHADRGLRRDPAQGPRHRDGRRVHRHEAGRRHARKTVDELFIPGTEPTQVGRRRRGASTIDAASRPPLARGLRRARWSPARSSTSATSRRGYRSLAAGRHRVAGACRAAAPASRAGRRAPARRTSTAAASIPFGASWGSSGSRRPRTASSRRRRADAVRLDRPVQPVPAAPPEREPAAGPGNEGPATATANGGNGDAGQPR